MRDLVFALALFGVVVGVGCSAASAQDSSTGGGVEFETPAPASSSPVTLPATSPSGTLVGALVIAGALGVVAYITLK